MSSEKCCPFCLSLNVLRKQFWDKLCDKNFFVYLYLQYISNNSFCIKDPYDKYMHEYMHDKRAGTCVTLPKLTKKSDTYCFVYSCAVLILHIEGITWNTFCWYIQNYMSNYQISTNLGFMRNEIVQTKVIICMFTAITAIGFDTIFLGPCSNCFKN